MNHHLVILKKPYLDLILSGEKTIESRLTKGKTAAFGRVQAGDKLFLKASGGPVSATATVADVKYYPNLTRPQIVEIKQQYGPQIGGSDAVWETLMDRTCGFLVWLGDVRPIAPVRIDKKDWRAWVVLTKEKHFGLLAAESMGQDRHH
ncbi:MAG: ASCH domain-containing protein [Phycisphaerales bacterium]|nr:MAG: ASCH domain-containing protein [Phycisphaerales bacterium]